MLALLLLNILRLLMLGGVLWWLDGAHEERKK